MIKQEVLIKHQGYNLSQKETSYNIQEYSARRQMMSYINCNKLTNKLALEYKISKIMLVFELISKLMNYIDIEGLAIYLLSHPPKEASLRQLGTLASSQNQQLLSCICSLIFQKKYRDEGGKISLLYKGLSLALQHRIACKQLLDL